MREFDHVMRVGMQQLSLGASATVQQRADSIRQEKKTDAQREQNMLDQTQQRA